MTVAVVRKAVEASRLAYPSASKQTRLHHVQRFLLSLRVLFYLLRCEGVRVQYRCGVTWEVSGAENTKYNEQASI